MILQTQNVTKRYGSRVVLNNINLQIPDGSIYGLVGPNGAGKTTLLSIISGLRRQTNGQVLLNLKRQEIAICPDVPEFESWLTAFEVLDLSANLIGISRSKEEIEKLLDDSGLANSRNRKVGEFSRGMTQRLAIAATIIGEPKLIILDEPCSALDPSGRAEVLDTILQMKGKTTVIFSTHILSDVQRVCDQIGVLDKGHLLYQGDLNVFLNENVKPIWNITLRNNTDKVVDALKQINWITKVEKIAIDKVQITGASIEAVETQLIQILAQLQVEVSAIEPVESDLENAFLNLTRKDNLYK